MIIAYGIDWVSHPKEGFTKYVFKYKQDSMLSHYFCRSECIAHLIVITLNEANSGWKLLGVSNTLD